ncbi:aldo/keto reductase [Companilactobacillus alimentarius]|uniref:Oxidoreductase n=1 Tax=Companilactobacillus alimentarius DSM 20249 TaxID=1423720 RepID=A0A2K9HIF5_9LACO|nr:aldo/keto reductase [Companilactobacillus alimentarius]AUI72320.1 oxidoreductase [Companilactobacillus alimentarius DSM 20249]KRK76661.1 oxidoreductase [Companilactobacillus alimentarius DSM 20249]MDT6952900.1 aldo/keto reductase [Companilactobacillus alimentarius]GEO45660.1 oxidoreductase [Companilactobacillus alimentarius]
MTEETFNLNNGVEIPAMGIGTFQMPVDAAEQAVVDALKDGYRLIDTANGYMNETGVGRGIKRSGVNRSDIFLSTKLWPSVYTDENAVDDSLKRLGTDYVDLMFLHQPAGDFLSGYKQLEKAYKDGKVKAIGISNFQGEKLQQLLDNAEIKPQVIQSEAHPYFTEDEVRKVLKPFGTRLMAWYPLGHGDKSLINEPVFAQLGQKYGKSSAQIILRWHTQMGFIVIPGSTNPDHIKDNHNIFDFTLTDEEMAQIAAIKKNIRYYTPSAEAEERYANMKLDFSTEK